MKIKNIKTYIASLFFAVFFYQVNSHAAVVDASISINPGVTIDINLSQSINEPNMDSITVSATQQAGATAVLNGNLVTYTPPSATFVGTDSFTFDVLDVGSVVLGSGTVTIVVGLAINPASSLGTPSVAIGGVLNELCIINVPAGLVDLCNDFTLATPAELAVLTEALAPKELGGQNQLSTALASQQVSNIRSRLAALRQGIRGATVSQLSLRSNDNRSVAFDEFFTPDMRGGAAGAMAAGKSSGRVGVFGNGSVGRGKHSASQNEDGYKLSSRGLSFGTDYRVDANTVAGAALGLNSSGMNIDANGGDLNVKGFNLIGYGSFYIDQKTYVEAIFAAYKNTFSASRIVEYDIAGVSRSSVASSDTDNAMLSFSIAGGREVFFNRGLTINVSGSLDYIKSAFDGYAETGAGGANLSIQSRLEEQLTASINMHLTDVISLQSGVLLPQVNVALKHEFKQNASTIEGSFSNDATGSQFNFSTDTPDANYLKASAGFSYIIPGGTTGFMNFEKTFLRSDYSDYNFSLGMRVEL